MANKANVTDTSISYASIAAAVASSLVDAKQHENKAATLKESANAFIAQLHKAKVTVGRYGKCAVASAFFDQLIKGGWAKGTAANYLSVFKDAVKTGKPVRDWNPNRKGAAKSTGKRGGKGKAKASFAQLLMKAYNHDSGESLMTLCATIEADFEEARVDHMYDGLISFLQEHGELDTPKE